MFILLVTTAASDSAMLVVCVLKHEGGQRGARVTFDFVSASGGTSGLSVLQRLNECVRHSNSFVPLARSRVRSPPHTHTHTHAHTHTHLQNLFTSLSHTFL
eukprot:566872-Pleurochrysis_carterae.AAC.1